MPRKEPAQILTGLAWRDMAAAGARARPELRLQRSDIHRPRRCLMQAKRAADAEVIGIDHAAVDFHLLAFDADVGDPVLPATVGASGDVELQVLIEAGQAFFQFLDQPAREALGLRDCQLAEFRAAAGDGSAVERRSANLQSDGIEFFGQRLGVKGGTFTMSRFCMLVARNSPPAKRSARSAAACI